MKNYTFQWDTWYPSLFAVCTFFSPNETNFIVSLFYNKYRFEETAAGAHVPNPIRSTCLHSPPPATVSFLIRSFRFTFPSRFAPSNSTSPQHTTRSQQSFNPIPSYANRPNFGFRSVFTQTPTYTRGIIYAISCVKRGSLESPCIH